MNRRQLLTVLASTGIGSPVLHRAISTMASSEEFGIENLKEAEWITGIELSDEEREEILGQVQRTQAGHEALREIETDYLTAPAVHFKPIVEKRPVQFLNRNARADESDVEQLPTSDRDIAFLPVGKLAWFIKTGQLSSVRLTKIYLDRLKKYGPMLRCVISLTEILALQQAKRADEEIKSGYYRGPLHGIPWGAKDLIDVEGYPTTWGIPHYRERFPEQTATVAKRLEEAGAVLVAKLSLGALAQGDKWFKGMTRSPWSPRRGSSGSSAGSASATVAGLVGFSLGSETLGSILSPSIRCGATGMRPTFGRVSRYGCMPLSWTMDKIGPICRSVEDCALVFDAIHGHDGKDPTTDSYEFSWPKLDSFVGTKVGYRKSRTPVEEREDLKMLKRLGCELVEMSLPTGYPLRALFNTISVEGASVFDSMLREGHTEGWNTWTNTFRAAQHISAVDYLRYMRVRTKLMKEFEETIADVDFIVNMRDLVHTNFTGHPSIVFPVGYEDDGDGGKKIIPMEVTGHLYADDRLASFADACQKQVVAHQIRPELESWLEKFKAGTMDEKEEKQDLA